MFVELTRRRWNGLDDVLLPFALMGMQVLWVGLWMRMCAYWLGFGDGLLLAHTTLVGLMLGGWLWAKYGAYLDTHGRRAAILAGVSGLLAVIFALYLRWGAGAFTIVQLDWVLRMAERPGPALLVLVVAAWAWWRGMHLGCERPTYDAYSNGFLIGICALALAAALTISSGVLSIRETGLTLLAFCGLGLAALALASLSNTRNMNASVVNHAYVLTRYWFSVVALVIVVILSAGLLIARLVEPDMVRHLLAWAGAVWDGLASALLWVLTGILTVIFAILQPLLDRLKLLAGGTEEQAITPAPGFAEQFQDMQQKTAGLPPQLLAALKIAAVLIVLGLIVLVFVSAMRRFKELAAEDVEEQRESIFSRELLGEQIRRLLHRQRQPIARPAPFVSLAGAGPQERVRRAYQALLAWAAAQGVPRRPGQTPNEYAIQLAALAPLCRSELDRLTQWYLLARYSSDDLPVECAEDAEHLWAQLSMSFNSNSPNAAQDSSTSSGRA